MTGQLPGPAPSLGVTGGDSLDTRMVAVQEGPGHIMGADFDSPQRCEDGFAGAGSLDLHRVQHARRIAPQPGPALNNVSQGDRRTSCAELRRCSDNAFELLPDAGSSADPRGLKASRVSWFPDQPSIALSTAVFLLSVRSFPYRNRPAIVLVILPASLNNYFLDVPI